MFCVSMGAIKLSPKLLCTAGCLLIFLMGCSHKPPTSSNNVCSIFFEKPAWYKAARKSADRWSGPIVVPMAIMYQESSFKAKAKPPMQYFLGIIPVGRPSDAYGYSQALESTWNEYQKDIGTRFRARDSFANSYDFIQWYIDKTHKRNRVSKWDAYAQYLNYHEGQGGYARGSHKKKQWLLRVARKVDARAKLFSTQLKGCQPTLEKRFG